MVSVWWMVRVVCAFSVCCGVWCMRGEPGRGVCDVDVLGCNQKWLYLEADGENFQVLSYGEVILAYTWFALNFV